MSDSIDRYLNRMIDENHGKAEAKPTAGEARQKAIAQLGFLTMTTLATMAAFPEESGTPEVLNKAPSSLIEAAGVVDELRHEFPASTLFCAMAMLGLLSQAAQSGEHDTYEEVAANISVLASEYRRRTCNDPNCSEHGTAKRDPSEVSH